MTAFDWLWELNQACCGFFSKEKPKERASNSELKRWFSKSCVEINGHICNNPFESIEKINSIILFPKNDKQRITFVF